MEEETSPRTESGVWPGLYHVSLQKKSIPWKQDSALHSHVLSGEWIDDLPKGQWI